MRALPVVIAVFLASCRSDVTLDADGGLQFPCTPTSSTERSQGNCPIGLFCGADQKCHSPTVGDTYACRGDFDCGGVFRCGATATCVDPTADALSSDLPNVVLTQTRLAGARTPWDAGISALGAGRTFYRTYAGQLTDVTPTAVADGTFIYTVAQSQLGFTNMEPPVQFFVGRAQVGLPVRDVAVARDQVYAIAGDRLFHYQWAPVFGGPMPVAALDAGVAVGAVGDRLRVGSSAFPFVFEFKPDAGLYRRFDSSFPDDLGVQDSLGGAIEDMTDTDGRYAYAIVNGQVQIADKLGFNDQPWRFGTFQIHSPGRLKIITNCGGGAGTAGEVFFARSLHVGDNPDVNQAEQPLIGLGLDVFRGDAGTSVPYWMRIDPDPVNDYCGGDRRRHIGRGFCPACGDDERLKEMQWGVDEVGDSALRSECVGSAGIPSFYDLKTDTAGFSCFRKRRVDVGFRAPVTQRGHSSALLSVVASGDTVLTRRAGLGEYVPLTLDRAPVIAQSYGPTLVAFGQRTLYRETPQLGLALHETGQGNEPFPAWISDDVLFYDDGRIGPISNLQRAPADARIIAAPTRTDLQGPLFGSRVTTADGRPLIVMIANDTLLGGDLSTASVTRPAAIDAKVVPEPEVEILSVATHPTDGGSLFEGFVLTQNHAFALDAETVQQWSITELDVVPGRWLEVWTEATRGRLGYSDGRVYALPSGVPIAPRLEKAVRDYQSFCGRAYALTAEKLYRLDPVAGSPVGVWQEQSVLMPPRVDWVKMYGAKTGDLWVFAADGTAALLKGAPCN